MARPHLVTVTSWLKTGLSTKVHLEMRSELELRRVSVQAKRALVAALLFSGCSGPPPRTANPTRPLDERRAIEVIADVFRGEHEQPTPGGELALSAQHRLRVDVGAVGKRFGVAYVTANERAMLGSALAPDPSKGDALQLVSGSGSDSDARVCILYDSDYLYDDQAGETHEKSTMTAELKLRRDTRDFLVIARREHWK